MLSGNNSEVSIVEIRSIEKILQREVIEIQGLLGLHTKISDFFLLVQIPFNQEFVLTISAVFSFQEHSFDRCSQSFYELIETAERI